MANILARNQQLQNAKNEIESQYLRRNIRLLMFQLKKTDDTTASKYSRLLPGVKYCREGVEMALFAINNNMIWMMSSLRSDFPLLDWQCNLFLLACEKKWDVVKSWPLASKRTVDGVEDDVKLNSYGWTYGFDIALRNADVDMIKWFESQPEFNHLEIQSILDVRSYDSRNNLLRNWFAQKNA